MSHVFDVNVKIGAAHPPNFRSKSVGKTERFAFSWILGSIGVCLLHVFIDDHNREYKFYF